MKSRGQKPGLVPVIGNIDERTTKLERHHHTPPPDLSMVGNHVVRVTRITDFDIEAADEWTAIPFDGPDSYDPVFMHDPENALTSTRVYARASGVLTGGACVEFGIQEEDTGKRGLAIRKNGDDALYIGMTYLKIAALTEEESGIHPHAITITDPEHFHGVQVDESDSETNHAHDIAVYDPGGDFEHSHGATEGQTVDHDHAVGEGTGRSTTDPTGISADIDPADGEHDHPAFSWPVQLALNVTFEDFFDLNDYFEVMVYNELSDTDVVLAVPDYSPRAWAHLVVTNILATPVGADLSETSPATEA